MRCFALKVWQMILLEIKNSVSVVNTIDCTVFLLTSEGNLYINL